MSDVKIVKPIAKYADVPQITPFKPLAVAGTTLQEGALVYLLRQLPHNFLLTDFYDDTQRYNKIPVSYIQLIAESIASEIFGPG
jgi:hypothetical protein